MRINSKGFAALTAAIAFAFVSLIVAVFFLSSYELNQNLSFNEAEAIYELQNDSIKARIALDEALTYAIKESVDSSCSLNNSTLLNKINTKFSDTLSSLGSNCSYSNLSHNITDNITGKMVSVSFVLKCSANFNNLDVNYSTDVIFKKYFELTTTTSGCNIKVYDEQANHFLELDATT
ncbi:MAG: hypothetical protein J7L14_00090 [Candidatus Diapherotrites archaeon]|nr:hypothetical protein [Candidatus Diapherotrites archaeon]